MSAQVIKLGEGYFFLRIDNFFSSQELNDVWEEIYFLSYRNKFELDTKTSKNLTTGELKSNKIGIWLDNVYTNRKYGNFFKYYKKWMTHEAFNNLVSTSLFWRTLTQCNQDTTLLSYYEDGTYYKSHMDSSKFTQLFYTHKEPKKFSGGQIIFSDFNYSQEIKNNTLILFPGWFEHEVKPVILEEKTPDSQDKLQCNGRYVFTTFFD